MTFDADELFRLLPAIHRLRDVDIASRTPGTLTGEESAELRLLEAEPTPLSVSASRRLTELQRKRDRGPLAAFLTVLAEQIRVLEDNLDQLYDDQFVETAAPWALPYIGDLIGYRELHETGHGIDRRAEIAHTIAFRRRKGTASMIEQLARDVTGFHARAVEYFERLATTQAMNHRRPSNRVTPSLRDGRALEWLGGGFDDIPHTLDVRRIDTRNGRYNVPNIGVFLWRLDALRLEGSPAVADASDASGRRFRFSPLGIDIRLVGRPVGEDDISHLSGPANVPAPLTRRRLRDELLDLYGEERSIHLVRDGIPVPVADVVVCALPDAAGGWAHDAPSGKIAVDPVLGRLSLAPDLPAPANLTVLFHRSGVSGCFGGEYARNPVPATAVPPDATVPDATVPGSHATIQDALNGLDGSGVVEITDSGRYAETLTIDVAAGGKIELRAADGRCPTLDLSSPLTVTGGNDSQARLDGLLILGDSVSVPAGNDLSALTIAHCTLVPGHRRGEDGTPVRPGAPSVTVAARGGSIELIRSSSGPVHAPAASTLSVTDSIIDAERMTEEAIAVDGSATVESSTVIGRVRASSLAASNSILLARVDVVRRQEGCLRFSYVPLDSLAPRRYHCQPTGGTAQYDVPHFASLTFGAAGYGRLADSTPDSIRRGAEQESEMGAFRWRYEPQRTADLLTRFDEYLRVGLAAGIFHES